MGEICFQFPANQRQHLEQLPVALCIFQYIQGKIKLLLASDEVCQMIGISRKDFFDSYIHNFADHVSYSDKFHIDETVTYAINHPDEEYQSTYRVSNKDGSSFSVLCTGKVQILEDGTHLIYSFYTKLPDTSRGQLGKVTDVEKLLHHSEELKNANARLNRILNNVPAGIAACIIKDNQFKTLIVNKYLSDLFMISSSEAESYSRNQFFSFIHPNDRFSFEHDFDSFLNEQSGLENNCRLYRKGLNDYIWVHVTGKLIHTLEGSDIAYLSYTDITAKKLAESELHKTHRSYEKAIQAANLLLWEYDIAEHRIIMSDNETTQAICKKLGCPKILENIPDSLLTQIAEEDIPAYLEMYNKVCSGQDASCEIWFNGSTAHQVFCEHIDYIVEYDVSGIPVKAYGSGRDITEQKKAEERYTEQLRNMEEKTEINLIAKSQSSLTYNRLIDYHVIAGCAADLVQDTSYDSAALSVASLAISDTDRTACLHFFDRQNLIKQYYEGTTHFSFQYHRRKAKDTSAWIRFDLNTFRVPHSDEIECFIYTYDITEQIRNAAIMDLISNVEFDFIGFLYTKTEMFELIKESSKIKFPDPHKPTDYDICLEYIRRNFIKEDELVQYNQATSLKNVLAGLKKNDRYTATYRRTENGTIFCKQTDYVWLDKEEGIILMVRTDVTAAYNREQEQLTKIRKAKLQADQANEAKSMFLSSMSHDLRTPLNGILGFTDIALHETDPIKSKDYLSKIQSSGQLLLSLVNDTLELSRIESGKMILQPENCSEQEIIHSVVTALRPSAEEKNIHLILDDLFDTGAEIYTDRLKMQKIILNLVSNAIKYTPEDGTVHITASDITPSEKGYNYRLTVKDNGIGMSKKFQLHAFDPFAQEHRPEAANVTGTGLGLSIVKRIVTIMNGTITLQSEEGKGSCFTVDLPLPPSVHTADMNAKKTEKAISLKGRHILLCEDNYLNTEIATILLQEQGMTVNTAVNGKDGVEIFRTSQSGYYDAILMDIRMPVMDGYEAVNKIRSLSHPDAKLIPVIAMTADAFEEDIHKALESGMNGYVTKPIETTKLMTVLRESIGNRKKY